MPDAPANNGDQRVTNAQLWMKLDFMSEKLDSLLLQQKQLCDAHDETRIQVRLNASKVDTNRAEIDKLRGQSTIVASGNFIASIVGSVVAAIIGTRN